MEHEKALRQLAWAIENSTGEFKLILARCNYASLRARLIARLQEICSVEISVLQLREFGRTLYTAISEEFGDNLPTALMVVGLESVQGLSQMLTSANQVREEFRKHFPFPLVLWINDDIYKQLMQFAPDLESWATSKNFTIAPSELASYLRGVADLWFNDNLRLSEDDYLILEAELEAAPQDLLGNEEFFTLELQAILESLLGLVKKVNNQKDVAIKHYYKSLELWRQLNNLERQLKILNDIGYCYYLKSLKILDKTHPDWQAAKHYILGYLNLIYEHKQDKLIANASIIFGEALRDLEEWDALNKLVNLAIEIHKAENLPLDLARDYGFLAEIALVEERWQGAKSFACKALDILSPISILQSPDTSGVVYELEEDCIISYDASIYKFLIAKAQYNLGEKSEAIRNLEEARELSEPIQGLRLYLDILQYLQKLYFEEKEYLKAYNIKQEIFSVEQQFGLRAFIGAGRLQSFKGEAFSTRHKYNETMAPEIAASTRQLDVERLIERVGRHDYKLIVIYGESGVGKSSLINAGLEPALKNKPIGIKDNLPIVIRVYTNWQEECSKIFQQLAVNEERIRPVLIFDQFEEFFFVCSEPTQRRKFFEFLAECLSILSVKVILSLRVDYLHYLLECNDLSSTNISDDILSKNVLYKVGNFTSCDAKSIIQRLTQNANFPLESDLIDKLVEDLAGALGEVRPIELQIVGAQLQTDNINTLAKYALLGDKAKEELIKRYLQAVIQNCGAENTQVAELLLYSLTDDKGTRPLKTRVELERDLEDVITPSALSRTQTSLLDLVLEILVKSGLVLILPEKPDDRYQLVHDYIAAFIRLQQEPNLKALMDELQREREQRKVSEIKLNKFLKRALAGSIAAGFGLAVLSITTGYQAWEANKQKQQADINAVEAQINSSEALFNSGETRDASIAALKAGGMLKQGKGVTTSNQVLTTAALRQAVYSNYPATELATLTGHGGAIGVAWNPDGKTLASASWDNTIKLWDATTGKQIKILTGHSNIVIGVAWNPDGKTLASASGDKTIKLWDATTGKLLKTLTGHSDEVIGVAWKPDGKTLASASRDKTIKLWDTTTNKLLNTLTGHSNVVIGVAWKPDGKTLTSASRDKTIKLWDATTGKLLKTLTGHSDAVIGVAWNPNGKTLASASDDNTIKLWDATTGEPLKTLTGHSDAVIGVAWKPDGKTLTSASGDNTIKLWDATTGKLLKTLTGHSDAVIGVAWNPNGKTLASASDDNTIKLWDATTGKQIKILTGHSNIVIGVAWNSNGKTLASASRDNTIKLWDTTTNKLLNTLTGHSNVVIGVAWNPDSKTLASASDDKTIKLWDATTSKLLKTLTGHSNTVNGVAWNPDGKTLASASGDSTIKLWDATTGEPLKNLTGHSDAVFGVAWNPNGKTLASASGDKTIKLWDATTGEPLKNLTGHSDAVIGVTWNPDSKTLASASWDKTIKLWDATTGKLLKTLTGHSHAVIGVTWNPNGKTLASASGDKTIKLWDATTGKLLKTLTGHSDTVNGVTWNPNGKTLASASGDKTIKLWDFNLDNLVKSACSRLENYLAFHPEVLADLKVCQTPSLLARTAEILLVQGEEQARNGDIETATEKFREAKKWNPQLNFDPEKKARELQKQF